MRLGKLDSKNRMLCDYFLIGFPFLMFFLFFLFLMVAALIIFSRGWSFNLWFYVITLEVLVAFSCFVFYVSSPLKPALSLQNTYIEKKNITV